jgi:ankyrin repeat protein
LRNLFFDLLIINFREKGSVAEIQKIIKNGANINTQNKNKFSLLHKTIMFNRPEILKLLIKNGANINVITKSGCTLLHGAVICNRPEILKILIENGANINEISKTDKLTPLHLAITTNNSNMVRLLIDNGADVTLKTADGKTPLQLASRIENMAIIQAIQQGELIFNV